MKNFIFLSAEGETKTPSEINDLLEVVELDNLQVLGFEKGKTKSDAFQTFINENPNIISAGFDEVIIMELVSSLSGGESEVSYKSLKDI